MGNYAQQRLLKLNGPFWFCFSLQLPQCKTIEMASMYWRQISSHSFRTRERERLKICNNQYARARACMPFGWIQLRLSCFSSSLHSGAITEQLTAKNAGQWIVPQWICVRTLNLSEFDSPTTIIYWWLSIIYAYSGRFTSSNRNWQSETGFSFVYSLDGETFTKRSLFSIFIWSFYWPAAKLSRETVSIPVYGGVSDSKNGRTLWNCFIRIRNLSPKNVHKWYALDGF